MTKSKKIIILILMLFTVVLAYMYTLNVNNKYLLTNITSSKIDSVEVFSKDNSISYDINNAEYKDILKLIKKITKAGTFESLDGSILSDNPYSFTGQNKDINSYSIKVNFTSNTDIQLNNTSITCKYMIINIKEKILYYWIQTSSSINEMAIDNVDLMQLENYCSKKTEA